MEVLVTYDVHTEDAGGRRRLRRVANLCEGHGQRVQKSVFECVLNPGQLEQLRQRLLKVIDLEQDNLRIYRLREPRERYVETYGKPLEFDLRDPLVL